MIVTKFYNEARFTQRIKLLSDSATITGNLDYMTCDDEKCLPPTDEDFSFDLTKIAETASGKLEIWEADLLKEGSYNAAAEGSDAIIHMASPFFLKFKDKDDRIGKIYRFETSPDYFLVNNRLTYRVWDNVGFPSLFLSL